MRDEWIADGWNRNEHNGIAVQSDEGQARREPGLRPETETERDQHDRSRALAELSLGRSGALAVCVNNGSLSS